MIHEKLLVLGSRIGLVGLGGVGIGNHKCNGGPSKANFILGKLGLLSNTATMYNSNQVILRSLGFIRAPWRIVRKVSVTWLTVLRFLGVITVILIYSNSLGTGYKTEILENRSLS